jgi:hypothetical protein
MENTDSSPLSADVPRAPALRFFAHFFSILFHPVFIASYVCWFMIFLHPVAFLEYDDRTKMFRFLAVALSTTFFPLFSVFLLSRLRLGVESLYLRTQRERIIPYALAMIYYWWIWHVYNNLPDTSVVPVHFLFGAFLAICGAWFCNIFLKVSIHAISMGSMVMFFLLFSFADNRSSGLYLSIALLTAGIVCTSRLVLSAHHPREIYIGLLVGMLAQWIGWQL